LSPGLRINTYDGAHGQEQGSQRGERAGKHLTDELGFEVKRKLGQARDGGDDIQIGKYRIEVKRREALRLDDWCQQIEACCDPKRCQWWLTDAMGSPGER
jgi:hypothetical protein